MADDHSHEDASGERKSFSHRNPSDTFLACVLGSWFAKSLRNVSTSEHYSGNI